MTLTTLSLSLLLFAAMVRGDVVCPAKFVALGERCYRFFPDKQLQFGPAAGLCSREKSELVGLESKEEEDDVTKYLAEHHGDVTSWRTGGMKLNGKFVWHNIVSGSKPIKYTHWPGGRVQSGSSIILKKTKSGQYQWAGAWMGSHSQRPKYQHAVICETKPLEVKTTKPPLRCPTLNCFAPCPYGFRQDKNGCDTCDCVPMPRPKLTNGCPSGFTDLGSGLCHYIGSVPETYTDAKRICESLGGELPHLQNLDDGLVLSQLTNNYFWIGLTDAAEESVWVWEKNGAALTDNSWHPGRMKNTKSRNCALFHPKGLLWGNENCDNVGRGYICTKKIDRPNKFAAVSECPEEWTEEEGRCFYSFKEPRSKDDATRTCEQIGAKLGAFTEDGAFECDKSMLESTACPPDWTRLQSTGKCYRQFPHPATYSSARRQCEAEAGTLAMPKTEEISRELANITQKWYWIGLDDLNKENIFTWVDGEVGKWIPWGANQPDGVKNGKKEDCVLMHKAVWNDYPCNSRYKFVCERGDTTSGDESNQQTVCKHHIDRCTKVKGFSLRDCCERPWARANCKDFCPAKHIVACEHHNLTIKCAAGHSIRINSAKYGRMRNDVCPHSTVRHNTTACFKDVTATVQDKCQSASCTFKVNNANGDPCHGVHKFLEVDYECLIVLH